MNETVKNKLYALSGFIGALLFMTGDCLIYCKTGLNNSSVEPLWSEMSEQRFIISAVLGFIGMSLMLPACLSFYRMIADTCGKAVRILTSIGFIGVASTGYLHFALGTLSSRKLQGCYRQRRKCFACTKYMPALVGNTGAIKYCAYRLSVYDIRRAFLCDGIKPIAISRRSGTPSFR